MTHLMTTLVAAGRRARHGRLPDWLQRRVQALRADADRGEIPAMIAYTVGAVLIVLAALAIIKPAVLDALGQLAKDLLSPVT